jgi:hypothetical protein
MANSKQFLNIASHHISKVDLEHCLKSGETIQSMNKIGSFQKKFKKDKRLRAKQESIMEDISSVLVLERKKMNKTDEFFTTLPPT